MTKGHKKPECDGAHFSPPAGGRRSQRAALPRAVIPPFQVIPASHTIFGDGSLSNLYIYCVFTSVLFLWATFEISEKNLHPHSKSCPALRRYPKRPLANFQLIWNRFQRFMAWKPSALPPMIWDIDQRLHLFCTLRLLTCMPQHSERTAMADLLGCCLLHTHYTWQRSEQWGHSFRRSQVAQYFFIWSCLTARSGGSKSSFQMQDSDSINLNTILSSQSACECCTSSRLPLSTSSNGIAQVQTQHKLCIKSTCTADSKVEANV